ncbi:MAG TPA: fluoride efflux transporter CrcB [Propionibacteriaceae bacterium]|nr:fluoride efflux transporter CrcB [Propionibacteriaceae bacterium]
MSPALLLAVSLAGGLGALLRLVLDALIRRRTPGTFPWATWVINLTGSALLGLLTGLTVNGLLPPPYEVVAGTGFLGGYTTFSTASYETVRLARDRRYAAAMANCFGMLVLGVAGAAAGLVVGLAV